MKAVTLGKGLCVLLLLLCISVISYAELIMTHGVVYQQLELRENPLSTFSDMPGIRQVKDYLERCKLSQYHFNAEIEEAMLRARIQKKVIGTAA